MSKKETVSMPETSRKPATEVGGKEDLKEDNTKEIAQSFEEVKEKADLPPVYSTENKSDEEIRADIKNFRDQIKIGETKNAYGKYNEKLVLENEAKVRAAEKALYKRQETNEKDRKVAAIREEIKAYREKIKSGETKNAYGKYNEELVLENEAKLRGAEKRLEDTVRLGSTVPAIFKQTVKETENKIEPVKKKPSRLSTFFKKLFSNLFQTEPALKK